MPTKNSAPLTTPDEVLDALGGTNEAASLFRCTAGAISQWRANGIPRSRQYEVVAACKARRIRIDADKLFARPAAA